MGADYIKRTLGGSDCVLTKALEQKLSSAQRGNEENND